ncbi:hypothetical protein A6768_03260 [Sphingobium yanoikuyae]|uniref:Uncharacterized protein n=2 Tax=Sphingobium yanoikuyae TaxID=13690 RepID=A0A291MVK6_SPHYA|nr:hypothetical protein A6768_03260 [Sphingobium yanoikuyae]
MRQASKMKPIEPAELYQLRADSARRSLHHLRMEALGQPDRRQGYDLEHDRRLAEMYFNTFAALAHRQRHSDTLSLARVIKTMADAAQLCDTAVDPPRCRKELDRLVDEFLSLAEKDGD